MKSFLSKHWFVIVLALLAFFNVFDAVSTDYVLSRGLAVEANPLMSFLYQLGPAYFYAFKYLVIAVAIAVAWKYREVRSVRVTTVIVTVLYECLFWYQIALLIYLRHQ
jgi:hypothetical protein